MSVRVSGSLAEYDKIDIDKVLSDRKCSQCAHLNVCAIQRAIIPLLNNWQSNRPFEAEEIAKICKEFQLKLSL